MQTSILSRIQKALCLVVLAVAALPAVSAEDELESLTLTSGVTIPCRIGGYDADKGLEVASRIFAAPVRVRTTGLMDIRLHRTKAEPAGASLVQLTNGDGIVGNLTALDDEVVSLDTIFGPLDIPLDVVHAIDRRRQFGTILESDFQGPELKLWKVIRGAWESKGKAARSSGERTYDAYAMTPAKLNILAREVPHKGPVTLIARVDGSRTRPPRGRSPWLEVSFLIYAQNVGRELDRGDYMLVTFTRERCIVKSFACGSLLQLDVRTDALTKRKGELRIAFDPESGILRAWVNGKMVVNAKWVADANARPLAALAGRYIAVRTAYQMDLYGLGLYSGIIPPDALIQPRLFARKTISDKEAESNYRIILTNGDHTFAPKVELEDDTLTLTTDVGEFRMPWKNVARMVTPTKNRKPVALPKHEVRLHLELSAVTVNLDKMTATEVVGTTPFGARLRIPRAAVARIDMHPAGRMRSDFGADIDMGQGAVLRARITRIARDHVGVRTSWLEGEVKLNPADVERITLRTKSTAESGRDMIALTDGSRIVGTLAGIGADAVTFQTHVAGKLTIPRKHVRNVVRDLISSVDFRAGRMEKWIKSPGEWKLVDTGLRSPMMNTSIRSQFLARPLKQNGPVTVEITSHRPPGGIVLFAREATFKVNMAGGIRLFFSPTHCFWGTDRRGKNYEMTPATALGSPPNWHGTATMAYDPATKQLSTWSDGKLIGTVTAPAGPTKGKYILLSPVPSQPSTYESIHIWKGIAPNGILAYLAKTESDTVVAMDGTRLSGADLRMSDGSITMTSDGKQHETTWDKVRAIGLAKSTPATIQRQPNHAMVYFDRSEILVRIEALTDTHLTGASPAIGPVRIPRARIMSIRLHAPKLPKPKD